VEVGLVCPDKVVPSQMVGVSACVNLPLHHKVQKFSSGAGSPGWSRKRAVEWLWCVVWCAGWEMSSGQRAIAVLFGREGNRRSDVTMAMHHRS